MGKERRTNETPAVRIATDIQQDGEAKRIMNSTTACYRCRQQKRKCSRDLPKCRRCREFEAGCEYPLPPNRRLLALQRWNRRVNHSQGPLSHAISLVDDKFALLEIYFSQFISASILFDKDNLYLNYRHENIPKFLLESLLGFSSILATRAMQPHHNSRTVHSYTSRHCQNDSFQSKFLMSRGSNVMPVVRACSSVEDLLASFHISLYCFAHGQIKRARSIADSTFQSCLRLTLLWRANAIEVSPQSALSTFGVYWFIRCFVQEPKSVDSCFILEFPDKPALSRVREILRFVQVGRSSPYPLEDNGTEKPFANFRLLALMGCWFRVREFVHDLHRVEDPVSMISRLTKLDIHITACYESLDTERAFSRGSDSIWRHWSLVSKILYHQCRAVAHLYIYLCNLRKDASEHEFLQMSAIIAIRHIMLMSEPLKSLLVMSRSGQSGSIPPFVAYSTFLAASVQLGSIVHLRTLEGQYFPGNWDRLLSTLRFCALINLSTLNHLRGLWTSAHILWEKLLTLASHASISIPEIDALRPNLQSMLMTDQITTTDTELQSLVSGHFSSILSIIDITEPFYLNSESENPYQFDHRFCGTETPHAPKSHPMHGNVMSPMNEVDQSLPEMHDHLSTLGVNFF